jgi:hypothetical protein
VVTVFRQDSRAAFLLGCQRASDYELLHFAVVGLSKLALGPVDTPEEVVQEVLEGSLRRVR